MNVTSGRCLHTDHRTHALRFAFALFSARCLLCDAQLIFGWSTVPGMEQMNADFRHMNGQTHLGTAAFSHFAKGDVPFLDGSSAGLALDGTYSTHHLQSMDLNRTKAAVTIGCKSGMRVHPFANMQATEILSTEKKQAISELVEGPLDRHAQCQKFGSYELSLSVGQA